MLFAGSQFYPYGGWEDFRGYFDSVECAKIFLLKEYENFSCSYCSWSHIVQNGKIIVSAILDEGVSPIEWQFQEIS